MTTPELITDEIVKHACDAFHKAHYTYNFPEQMRAAILAIQDDITRPVYNLLRGYKQDAEAYERALKEIRNEHDNYAPAERKMRDIADKALKGDYHKTDFTGD